MAQKVLLLQPTVGQWDQMRSRPALPTALIHAATLVRREFDVEIFDRRLHIRDWEDLLRERLASRDLLLVGVTAFTGAMVASSLEMCQLVRKVRPDLPIVWGGIHASLLPQQTAESAFADYVIQGEGEHPLLELARALASGAAPGTLEIPGVWQKTPTGVQGVDPGKRMIDLNELPFPAWELVDIEQYLPLYNGRKSLYFQSSRGCPLKCSYCYNVVYNSRRWRALDPENTLAQVRHVMKHFQVEDIYFVDDMFFTNIKRARAIAHGLKELNVTWQVQGVDILGLKRMTDEDYQLLVDSGCQRLTVGVESGSPTVRQRVYKDGTVEDVIDVTRRLAAFPMTLYYSFMCGIPGETLEDLKMSVDLMFRLLQMNPRVHVSPFYNFTPYPGTELFETAVKLGMPAPKSLEEWADYNHENTNLFPERKNFYESLYFTSLFLDNKSREYGAPGLIQVLSRLYQPVARFRTKNFFFNGLVERHAFNAALALWKGVGTNMLRKKPLSA